MSFSYPNGHKLPPEIETLFEIKVSRLNRRAKTYGKTDVDENALYLKLYENFIHGFKCDYCRRELSYLGASERTSFSFDHITPLSKGGDNVVGNLSIACNECNSLKGTLGLQTFLRLIEQLSAELRAQMWKDQHAKSSTKIQTEWLCNNCFNLLDSGRCAAGLNPKINGRARDFDSICGYFNTVVK